MGQLPQGGGAHRVQQPVRKPFGYDPNQVFPLEPAGPLIFRCGLYLRKIAVHLRQLQVLAVPLHQSLEVNIHGVKLRLLPGGGLLRLDPAAGLPPLVLGEDLVVRVDAEQHPADLQLGLGEHPEVLHLQLRHCRLEIDIPQREHPAAAEQNQDDPSQLHPEAQSQPAQIVPPPHGAVGKQPIPEHGRKHHRHRHHQNGEPVQQDLAHRHIAERPRHHHHLGQGKDGQKGLKEVIVHRLCTHPKGNQGGAQDQQPPSQTILHPPAQGPQQHGDGDGEEEGEHCPCEGQPVEAVQLQKQLLIVNDAQEKQRRSRQPPPAAPKQPALRLSTQSM